MSVFASGSRLTNIQGTNRPIPFNPHYGKKKSKKRSKKRKRSKKINRI